LLLRNLARALDNLFMRLFVGIPLAAKVIGELSATCGRLRSGGDGLRWTAPPSRHITLQFLGNASQEQYECIDAQLRKLHLPAVPVRLGDLGCFDRAGVFIAGVKVSPELVLLQQHVTAATADCGFAAETRAYEPHITLARSKGQRQGLNQLKARLSHQPKFTSFVAAEFVLYESFLGAGGSRYEIRERFLLNG
jgi:2'-5' RNA ligase